DHRVELGLLLAAYDLRSRRPYDQPVGQEELHRGHDADDDADEYQVYAQRHHDEHKTGIQDAQQEHREVHARDEARVSPEPPRTGERHYYLLVVSAAEDARPLRTLPLTFYRS